MTDDRTGSAGGQPNPWNSNAGSAWVELQPMLDAMFAPFEAVLARAVPKDAGRVLDIGCGAGATTRAIARGLEGGSCTGLDISEALIALARRRAEAEGVDSARFVVGDGQDHEFGEERFDALVSRFGVMFFADPAAAFANLRSAAREGAEMTLIVWRSRNDNPFMTTAERAAAPLLPQLKPVDPEGPGQFAFADPDRVRRILSGSWTDIDIAPLDVECELTVEDLDVYEMRMGRVAQLLPDLDAATRAEVRSVVRAAFEPFVTGDTVRFTAACWIVRGKASR